jgi:hypothetical protein
VTQKIEGLSNRLKTSFLKILETTWKFLLFVGLLTSWEGASGAASSESVGLKRRGNHFKFQFT